MPSYPALLIAVPTFLIVGCSDHVDAPQSDLADATVDSPIDLVSEEIADDPFADLDGDLVDGTTVPETVDFQVGDLVPCSDTLAEFRLEIKALSKGKCFYQRKQAFRHYDGGTTDPSSESGMTQDFTLCAILANGFASGTFRYIDLAPNAVTVIIDWKASQGNDEQKFVGAFTLTVGASGVHDAGHGNRFDWSLMPVR